MNNLYDFEFKDLQGNVFPMQQLEGKVLLVVNTASQCGFTPITEASKSFKKSTKLAVSVF